MNAKLIWFALTAKLTRPEMRFTLLMFLATIVTTAIGQAVAPSPAPVQVSSNWLVDLRTVCTVGAVVLLGAWRISAWMSRIDDRLAAGEKRFEALDKRADNRDMKLDRIERTLAGLPCGGKKPCPQEDDAA